VSITLFAPTCAYGCSPEHNTQPHNNKINFHTQLFCGLDRSNNTVSIMKQGRPWQAGRVVAEMETRNVRIIVVGNLIETLHLEIWQGNGKTEIQILQR
jgi:hypothetical protein